MAMGGNQARRTTLGWSDEDALADGGDYGQAARYVMQIRQGKDDLSTTIRRLIEEVNESRRGLSTLQAILDNHRPEGVDSVAEPYEDTLIRLLEDLDLAKTEAEFFKAANDSLTPLARAAMDARELVAGAEPLRISALPPTTLTHTLCVGGVVATVSTTLAPSGLVDEESTQAADPGNVTPPAGGPSLGLDPDLMAAVAEAIPPDLAIKVRGWAAGFRTIVDELVARGKALQAAEGKGG